MNDDDFKLLRGFADGRTDERTDEQTFVIVESLSRLKRHCSYIYMKILTYKKSFFLLLLIS